MATSPSILKAETFRFLRDLRTHNRKDWMDANRDRYRQELVQPLRELFTALSPAVLKLHSGFDTGGRTGVNFSRINRDIRFAKDKTPYRPQMYLSFPPKGGKSRRAGELYVGVSPDSVTAGFRIYFDPKTKSSALAARSAQLPAWSAKQKRRLARKYESYWYSMEKSQWTKNEGWPTTPEQWKKLKAWIVRRAMKPALASRSSFNAEAAKIFRDLFPLHLFLSLQNPPRAQTPSAPKRYPL